MSTTRLFSAMVGLFALCMASCAVAPSASPAPPFASDWPEVDRIWVGPGLWANRLQDWRTANGRLECVESRAGKPLRTVHLLTHRLGEQRGDLTMSVTTGVVGDAERVSANAASGFLVGAGATDLDYRAAALVHHATGPDAGILAAIDAAGRPFLHDLSQPLPRDNVAATVAPRDRVTLLLTAAPADDAAGRYNLTLRSFDSDDAPIGETTLEVDADALIGNVALVSNPGVGKHTGAFWFDDWRCHGSKFDVDPSRSAGPILASQYTLSRGVLKLTAQMMPLGEADHHLVQLETQEPGGAWRTRATATIIEPGWTATFRIANWDDTRDTPYRIVYKLRTSRRDQTHTWSGTIRRDPVDKPSIVVAAFTGNHNTRSGIDRETYDFSPNAIWFPHNDVTDAVTQHQPDLLFFSGDQVYEGASPTNAERSPIDKAELDYLYKWYLWCWAFRDLARDIPCISIPDDHDVYHPNLWGAGGRATTKDDKGGYVMPAEWVRMIERTQTSHLPDPFDPTPIEQGIGVYYTELLLGRISFAVLEDRKFKSGPAGLVPPTTSGRADHVVDPDFDPRTADVPGAELLGERQLEFLRQWARDWRGVDMKATLSQTAFAGLATHHGPRLGYLVADYDSNGWPQSGRNTALRELRRAAAFMIGGDQHLATATQHGIDTWDDAGWSFVVPSIANFYPRAWMPPGEPHEPAPDQPAYTGRYLDGFGNHVTVHAHTNPRPMNREPAALHDRMPGYGIVRFDKVNRTITMECWPRFADPAAPDAEQYEGWPITISQFDNGITGPLSLGTIELRNKANAVVAVTRADTGETVFTVRMKGTRFTPRVYEPGAYTVTVSDPATGETHTLEDHTDRAGEEHVVQFAR